MGRLLLGLVAIGTLSALAGCGPGPIHDRLYTSEWKSRIRSPIPLYKNWHYDGEHWERTRVVEGDVPEHDDGGED